MRTPNNRLAAFRARRVAGGAPDAHVKIPHLSADGRLLTDLGLDDDATPWAARLPHRALAAAA